MRQPKIWILLIFRHDTGKIKMEFTKQTTPRLLERFGKVCSGQWTNAYDRALRQYAPAFFPSRDDAESLRSTKDSETSNSRMKVNAGTQTETPGRFIPEELFDNIVDLVRNKELLDNLDQTSDQTEAEISRYEDRIQYVIRKNAEATSWMANTRDPIEEAECLEILETRQERYEKASEELSAHNHERTMQIEQAWKQYTKTFKNISASLATIQTQDKYRHFVDPSALEMLRPIGDAELDEDEEDCKLFARLIGKESGVRCREEIEWEWAQTRRVDEKRRELNDVRGKILTLEQHQVNETENNESHSLTQARERALQVECELKEALEVVWEFSNDYNSNGSFIAETVGSCSIPCQEDLEDVDPEPEITLEEYEEMQTKTTEAVQKWQHKIDTTMDPEDGGPPSPQPTDDFHFDDAEADFDIEVEVEDSLSQAGGLIDPRLPKIHRNKQARETIDSWAAENERIRNTLGLENGWSIRVEDEAVDEVDNPAKTRSSGLSTKSNSNASRCSDEHDDSFIFAPEAKRTKIQP